MLVVHMSYESFSSTGNYPDTMVLEGESWLLWSRPSYCRYYRLCGLDNSLSGDNLTEATF